jgi:hypothetical protein
MREYNPLLDRSEIKRNTESNSVPVTISRLRKLIYRISSNKLTITLDEGFGYKIAPFEELSKYPARVTKRYLRNLQNRQ